MAKKETKEENLPVISDLSNYSIMSVDENIGAMIAENLGGEMLQVSDLEKIKIPSGESTIWTIATPEGRKNLEELEGIIIHHNMTRAYWIEDYTGGSTPPDCFSVDAINGIGTPGGSCLTCPLKEFGSGKDGSKACDEKRIMFVLFPDSVLPTVIRAPKGSLKSTKKYFLDLGNKHKTLFFKTTTKLRLDIDTNKKGVLYPYIVPTIGTKLSDKELIAVQEYRKSILPFLGQAIKDIVVKDDDGDDVDDNRDDKDDCVYETTNANVNDAANDAPRNDEEQF